MSQIYTMPATTGYTMAQPSMIQSGPTTFAPSTTFQPTSFQPVQVGASGTWQQTGPLPQHYYGAMTVDGGYQVPPNLFHDPNVINLNTPGTAGTQFVLGAPMATQLPTTMTLQAPPAPPAPVKEAKRDVKVAKKKPKKKKSCGCC